MSDYRVTVKVRNARLLRAIRNCGYESIPKFCKDSGACYHTVNKLLNMTISPFSDRKGVIPAVSKIIDFTCEPFEALFSEAQCEALATNKSERDVSAEQMFALIGGGDDRGPLELIIDKEEGESAKDLLACLNKQEAFVLRARLGIDDDAATLDEVGRALNVTRARISQVEKKALTKVRHFAKHGHV